MAILRGDIILVPFPFTDLSSTKVRPAVIVSADPQGEDIVIAFISSAVPPRPQKTDLLLSSADPTFSATGLKRDSVFRMAKLLTISSTLVLRRLGHAAPSLQKKLDILLKKSLGLA